MTRIKVEKHRGVWTVFDVDTGRVFFKGKGTKEEAIRKGRYGAENTGYGEPRYVWVNWSEVERM